MSDDDGKTEPRTGDEVSSPNENIENQSVTDLARAIHVLSRRLENIELGQHQQQLGQHQQLLGQNASAQNPRSSFLPYQANINSDRQPNQAILDPASGTRYGTQTYAATGGIGLGTDPTQQWSNVRLTQANSEYENVRDKVKHIRLPEDFKLHDSRTGVKKDDQQQYNRLTKSARMVETALRILTCIDTSQQEDTTQIDDKLSDLFITLFALIRYLQDEYAVLMVAGSTNAETARIFRSFRRNTSAFSPDVIEDLRNAAAVVAAGQVQTPGRQTQTQNRDNYRGRGYNSGYGGRGRGYGGRGGFRGYNRGYNQYQNQGRDAYAQFGRNVPPTRDREDTNAA